MKSKCTSTSPLFCILGIIIFLSNGSKLTGQADSLPYRLGKAKEFLKQMKSSSGKKEGTKVLLPFPDGRKVAGTIEFKQPSDSTVRIKGYIDTTEITDFFFKVSNEKLEGAVVFREMGKAYKYYSDVKGDVFVKEVDADEVLCLNYPVPAELQQALLSTNSNNSDSIPLLESLPWGNGCVYLDFDGEYVQNSFWDNGLPIDAAPSGLSSISIQEVWEIVSEDFLPLNVNITTSLAVFNSYPPEQRQRVIFTPTNYFSPNVAGIAYVGSFGWTSEEPCWIFSLSKNRVTGEAASHEIGHTLGLDHDGRTHPQEEYYSGNNVWAPIMGTAYYASMSQWSRGEYNNANDNTNDLIQMAAAGFPSIGFRTDDHSNYTGNATLFKVAPDLTVNQSGIIERNEDVDFFQFNSTGGMMKLFVRPAVKYANLNVNIRLYDEFFNLIAVVNPEDTIAASLIIPLQPGQYYVGINGAGHQDPLITGYSNYGSLGSYTITGTLPALPGCNSLAQDSRNQYINYISLANITNASGNNNGYGNFTGISFPLTKGSTYQLEYQPGFPFTPFEVFWNGWIDFNGNGSFEDKSEQILNDTTYGNEIYFQNFTIPDSLTTEKTKMRISLSFLSPTLPCDIISYGEVEDYSIELKPNGVPLFLGSGFKEGATMLLYPVPAKNYIEIETNGIGRSNGTITSGTGALVKSFYLPDSHAIIDISELPQGTYFVSIYGTSGMINKKFIK